MVASHVSQANGSAARGGGKLGPLDLARLFVLGIGTAGGIAGFAFWMSAVTTPPPKPWRAPVAGSLATAAAPSAAASSSGSAAARSLNGRNLFMANCAACHGPDLHGVSGPNAVPVPSLGNPDFLSVASDDYLRTLISRGRSGTVMPPWSKKYGGPLDDDQIDAIVAFIRSHEPKGPDLREISAAKGDPRIGRALFRGNCALCHGKKGEGGIGTSLRTPGFLELASDRHIIHTIVNGRPNTGMPSWRKLSAQQVSDILAFIRSWQGERVKTEDVLAYLRSGKANARIGRKLFRSRCSACHGKKGEGAIGPSLRSPDFQALADDSYLIGTIRDGRPGTAMPSWTEFAVEDLGDLVAYVRSLAKGVRPRRPVPPAKGDPIAGKRIYDMACRSCHGAEGTGGVGPQLANPVFLRQASDAFLAETIRYGLRGSAMRGFLKGGGGKPWAAGIADLREKDVADVVAYIRSLQGKPIDPLVMRPVLGNAHRGKWIYEKKASCAQCHGVFGEGGVGPALGNPAFLEQASEGFLIGTMVLGRDGTEMRSFVRGGISALKPEDLMDVAAYVRTLPYHLPEGEQGWRHFKPSGPVSAGKKIFESNCMGCHGKEGKGGYAPTLSNPEFLSAASDGFLIATIARGRQTTPMRGFGPGSPGISTLTPDEIRLVVGYLRSLMHKKQ